MRRRIQAVARGQGRCDCGPIGIRLSRNGRPGAAVGFEGGTSSIDDRIKGPFHQRTSRVVDGANITDVFSVFVYGAEESDLFQWVAPADYDGVEYAVPGVSVSINTPNDFATTVTIDYDDSYASGPINIAVFANGALLMSCLEIGAEYGA